MIVTLDWDVTNKAMIGKSYFLSYILVLRLLEGLPTVFLSPKSEIFIFMKGRCNFYGLHDVNGMLESFRDNDVNWWVLLDTPNIPDSLEQQIQNPRWTFLHAASPESLKKAKAWSKSSLRLMYYMDIWSKEELYFAG